MSLDGNVGRDGRVWFVMCRAVSSVVVVQCRLCCAELTVVAAGATSCNTDMDSVNNELFLRISF